MATFLGENSGEVSKKKKEENVHVYNFKNTNKYFERKLRVLII